MEGTKIIYPVILYVLQQVFGTIRIQVVSKYCTALLGSRNCKGSYSCKYIRNNIFRLELLDKPIVLSM